MPPAADEPPFLEPDYNARIARAFSWWTREHMLAKKFSAVRLARGSDGHMRALADHPGPVIAAMNHVSWWDPLVILALHRLFWPDRTQRAPMDIAQLRKLGIFRKLGVFGVDPDDPRSLDAMARSVGAYFKQPDPPTLWINPQGRFEDPRVPVEVRPGAPRLAADAIAAGLDVRAVAIAVEYAFWLDPKPEVLIRVEPIEPAGTNTPAWMRATRDAMRRNAECLAELVIARDPSGFEHLLGGGRAKVNPMYDLWLKLRGATPDLQDRSRPTGANP